MFLEEKNLIFDIIFQIFVFLEMLHKIQPNALLRHLNFKTKTSFFISKSYYSTRNLHKHEKLTINFESGYFKLSKKTNNSFLKSIFF
jgi:hypothetical protein